MIARAIWGGNTGGDISLVRNLLLRLKPCREARYRDTDA